MAGSGRRDGWKTLDNDPKYQPDFLATIPPLPDEVRAIEWDDVEWIHGISSLHPWEAVTVLKQIYDVMHVGGRLVLEQPNIVLAAESVVKGGPIRWLFGDPQDKEPGVMNRWGYTPETLGTLLREAGFVTMEITKAQYHLPSRDFRIEAIV